MIKGNFFAKSTLIIALAVAFSFSSCKDNKGEEPTPKADYTSQLTNISDNVISATYADLAGKASTLLSEVTKLKDNPSSINLNNARGAWRDTRAPWEKSEGFLFGPVDTKGIDPAIDDWPVDVVQLDSVLASTSQLIESTIEGFTTTLKGFHTIEYLLWDSDGSKEIDQFTSREFEYLLGVTENLRNKTKILSDSWAVSGENYGKNLREAGQSGSLFISQKAALEQLVEAITGICDEVGSGKIAGPLGDTNPVPIEEESRFSHNSKNDFANNIRSISNIYTGSYNIGNGGLSDIIATKNATLDQKVLNAITAAINSIDAIPGNFSDAIHNNRADVANARDKVLDLKTILDQEVAPLVSGL